MFDEGRIYIRFFSRRSDPEPGFFFLEGQIWIRVVSWRKKKIKGEYYSLIIIKEPDLLFFSRVGSGYGPVRIRIRLFSRRSDPDPVRIRIRLFCSKVGSGPSFFLEGRIRLFREGWIRIPNPLVSGYLLRVEVGNVDVGEVKREPADKEDHYRESDHFKR